MKIVDPKRMSRGEAAELARNIGKLDAVYSNLHSAAHRLDQMTIEGVAWSAFSSQVEDLRRTIDRERMDLESKLTEWEKTN